MKIEKSLQKTLDTYGNTLALLGAEKEEEKLSTNDIIYIHDTMISKYGGICGVRDSNLLDSISKTPYQSCFGTDMFPTVFDKAAKLLYDFCNYQIFLDGNKRTGVATCNTLLFLNNYELTLSDIEMYELAMNIANHNIELADVQKIFKENCKIEILEECKDYDTGIQEKSEPDKQYEENESR